MDSVGSLTDLRSVRFEVLVLTNVFFVPTVGDMSPL